MQEMGVSSYSQDGNKCLRVFKKITEVGLFQYLGQRLPHIYLLRDASPIDAFKTKLRAWLWKYIRELFIAILLPRLEIFTFINCISPNVPGTYLCLACLVNSVINVFS